MPQAPPRLPARKPRTAQHQGWGNTKDGAARPKDRTAQHQGWSGATPKTEPRNVWAGAVQPKNEIARHQNWSGATPKRNLAMSGMERCNPKNEIARHQSWSGATSGTKQPNPIDRTAQPSRSSVSFEAGNQRPGRRFGHTHGAICREKAQAARACKGSCGRNLTAH